MRTSRSARFAQLITLATARMLAPLAALVLVSLVGRPLAAQAEETRVPTGLLSGSLYGQVSSPRGDFGKNTGTGGGGGGTLILRVDPSAILNLRTDLSFVTYGNSRRRIPLAGTGGLVRLDLRTSNNIFSMVTGPQLLGTRGAFTPYVSALGGFSVFWTQSSVQGTQQEQEPFASTTNSSDAALAYGGAAGMYIRVANGTRPVRLELGARLLRHDNVKYLNDQRVKDAFENERDPIPLRGRADFMTFYIGVNAFMY